MGIDDSKSYVMMSEGLEDEIQLEDEREIKKSVLVRIDRKIVDFQFVSIELMNDQTIILCVECRGQNDLMIKALLESSKLPVTLSGKEFNSQVSKVESGRCYLRLSR
jgi:hypothetical protein